MKIEQELIVVQTKGQGLYDVTERVSQVVHRSGVGVGMCTVFIRHTSASLVIQENADPSVLRDLEKWMARMAPESGEWEHDDEGPDDMPGHARAALLHTHESVPI